MKRRIFLRNVAAVTAISLSSLSVGGCAGPRRRRRIRRRAVTRHLVVWGPRRNVIRVRRRALAIGHVIDLPNGESGDVTNITDSHITINIEGNEMKYEYEDLDE